MENFNKKIYFLNKIYYFLFKERFNKKISFDFPKKYKSMGPYKKNNQRKKI